MKQILSGGATRVAMVLFRLILSAISSPAVAGLLETQHALVAELSKSYPGARIEILAGDAELSSVTGKIRFLGETPRSELLIAWTQEVGSDHQAFRAAVPFAAWVRTPVASRRVLPGERIDPANFPLQEMNVAVAPAREYRGVLFGSHASLQGLETRQTILEGQFLTSSAVQRVPDVRKGDAVRIEILSAGLSLTTQGIAEEPAYLGSQLRVMTGKTKKALMGRLNTQGVVEVRL